MTFEASIAHAHELEQINILNKSETKKIITVFKEACKVISNKKIQANSKYEDCHSAIEDYLNKRAWFSW